jgi:hypothetical protein
VPAAHEIFGIATLAVLAFVGALGIIAYARGLDPGRVYERLALVGLGALMVQLVLGAVLFAQGLRRPGLHYFYGIAPLGVLGIGIGLGRALRRDRWVPIAWATVIALGLALRAAFTGR